MSDSPVWPAAGPPPWLSHWMGSAPAPLLPGASSLCLYECNLHMSQICLVNIIYVYYIQNWAACDEFQFCWLAATSRLLEGGHFRPWVVGRASWRGEAPPLQKTINSLHPPFQNGKGWLSKGQNCTGASLCAHVQYVVRVSDHDDHRSLIESHTHTHTHTQAQHHHHRCRT